MITLQIDHHCLLVASIEIHNVLSVLNLSVGFKLIHRTYCRNFMGKKYILNGNFDSGTSVMVYRSYPFGIGTLR